MSTPVNAREATKPSWEQASWLWLALLVAVSQQTSSAVCEMAGYFGTERMEHKIYGHFRSILNVKNLSKTLKAFYPC